MQRKSGSLIPITTTVSKELHEMARKKGIKWNVAVARGIRVLSDMDINYAVKLRELEDDNTKLVEKIRQLGTRLTNYEAQYGTQ